jgi:hypothetical protein
MNNDLKNKLLKYKGTVSQGEVDYIQKLLPKNNSSLKKITCAAVSEKELEYLKKSIPNMKRYK